MGQKKRLKLCQYCDGQIDLDVIVCPYCGNHVSEPKTFSQKPAEESLFPPPYASSQKSFDNLEENFSSTAPQPKELAAEPTTTRGNIFLPTLLFSLGMNLSLLGLFILFFSKKGELLLKWDAHFWFVYVLLALPLMFFGYKGLSRS